MNATDRIFQSVFIFPPERERDRLIDIQTFGEESTHNRELFFLFEKRIKMILP